MIFYGADNFLVGGGTQFEYCGKYLKMYFIVVSVLFFLNLLYHIMQLED